MILRVVFADGYQVNHDLGNEYHFIDKEVSPDKFLEWAKVSFGETFAQFTPDTHGFVLSGKGDIIEPLCFGHKHYILSNQGDVFADLTHK